ARSRRWAMRAEQCRGWREEIGAFVLGHLGADERAALQAHLDACPACRAEVEALLPVGSLIEFADPRQLSTRPAPLGLGERVFSAIESQQRAASGRRRRRVALTVAACTASFIAIIAAIVVIGSPRRSPAEPVVFRSLPPGVAIG